MIAVKIERGAHLFSDLLDGNPLAVKLMILIFEKMHPSPSFIVSGYWPLPTAYGLLV